MESHILELLGSTEESNENRYKNNVQYNKKQYPLSKVHVKVAKWGKDTPSKVERAPWVANVKSVRTLQENYRALLRWSLSSCKVVLRGKHSKKTS